MAEQKYTVNAMGEQCPIPVVKTKKVLDSVQGDAEITVLVDNETAVQNLTRMGKNAGAEVLAEKTSDREFHVTLRVKDRKPSVETTEEINCIPDVKGDFVIAVDTATMGRGNDEMCIRDRCGLEVTSIRDVTPVPHNGCRPPKRRRV